MRWGISTGRHSDRDKKKRENRARKADFVHQQATQQRGVLEDDGRSEGNMNWPTAVYKPEAEQYQSNPKSNGKRTASQEITRKPLSSGSIRDSHPRDPRFDDQRDLKKNGQLIKNPANQSSVADYHLSVAHMNEIPESWLAEGDYRSSRQASGDTERRTNDSPSGPYRVGPSQGPQTNRRGASVHRSDEGSPSKSDERRARREKSHQDTFELSEEERRRASKKREGENCDCKGMRDRASSRLYQFKQELPDAHLDILYKYFDRAIPRLCSFDDIEMAIKGLIKAVKYTRDEADTCKKDFEMKTGECEFLKKTREDLESKISKLREEREREGETIVKTTRLNMKTAFDEAQQKQASLWGEKEKEYKKNEISYKKWVLELEAEGERLERESRTKLENSDAIIRELKAEKETWERTSQGQILELEQVQKATLISLQEERDKSVGRLENLVKETIKDCEKEKAEMKNQHQDVIAQIRADYENQTTQMKVQHQAVIDALEKQQKEEHRSLQERNQSLKGALVNRDGYKAMSDYKLASRFQELTTDVDAFARVQWDISRVRTWPFPDKAFVSSENPRMDKQYLFQNTIWVILYERIFFTPFRVLGEKGKSFEQQWQASFGEEGKSARAQAHGPPPTLDSEKWRYEIIKDCLDTINGSVGERDTKHDVKRDYERSMKEATDDILKELGRVATVTETNKKNFGSLVRNAAKFWLEVGQERYRLFLGMSTSGGEPSRSGQNAVGRDGLQKVVVVPELRRIGDAQGKGLETDRVVAGCQGVFSQFKSH